MAAEQAQLTNDLLWVINSPSFCSGPDTAPSRPLDPAGVDERSLQDFMAARNEHRVGRYFEHLLLYWLTEVRGVDMVGSGIQIRDGKRTVGEIDYLYRDEAGLLTHCEASVKFFLHHPRAGTSDFPGPNAVDNFERKINKLFDQQLQLSQQHYPDVVQRHAFVKGMIFYRDDVADPVRLPDRMPANHLRGRWLRESELEQIDGASGLIAAKPLWLASQSAAASVPIDELRVQLAEHFAGRAHPVMVSLFSDSGSESERLFVVPNVWPERPSGV